MTFNEIKKSKTFYSEQSLLKPSKIVEWKAKNKVYNFSKLPKTAILSLNKGLIDKRSRWFSKKLKGLAGHSYLLGQNSVYCSGFGNGAPAIVGLMEELRVFGVENFVFAGIAGSLFKEKKPKAYVVNKAYSTCGSTHFYSNETVFELRQSEWTTALKAHLNLPESVCWTTDAPFRETQSLVSHFMDKNVDHVDMETAAIYAFAEFYQVNALAVVVSGDSFVDFKWNPPRNNKVIYQIMKQLIRKIYLL